MNGRTTIGPSFLNLSLGDQGFWQVNVDVGSPFYDYEATLRDDYLSLGVTPNLGRRLFENSPVGFDISAGVKVSASLFNESEIDYNWFDFLNTGVNYLYNYPSLLSPSSTPDDPFVQPGDPYITEDWFSVGSRFPSDEAGYLLPTLYLTSSTSFISRLLNGVRDFFTVIIDEVTWLLGLPIVIDIGADGVEIAPQHQNYTFFDFDNDGYAERTAWVGKNDGLLVYDANEDGEVTASEIAFATLTDVDDTDLQALAALFDTNNDGYLDNADSEWSKFRVWQDYNSDGNVDAGELKPIQDVVQNIRLIPDNDQQGLSLSDGTFLFNVVDVLLTDGRTSSAADVAFAYSESGVKRDDQNNRSIFIYEDGGAVEHVRLDNTEINFLIDNRQAASGSNHPYYNGPSYITSVIGNDLDNILDGGDAIIDIGLSGAAGDDTLIGGIGDDYISGGNGADIIIGGTGVDILQGGAGSDSIQGGAGDDTLIIDTEDLMGAISGGEGIDTLVFDGDQGKTFYMQGLDVELLIAGGGNDHIYIPSDPDQRNQAFDPNDNLTPSWFLIFPSDSEQPALKSFTVDAGGGDDYLYGSMSSDVLIGGEGNDHLLGGLGSDHYLYKIGDGTDIISEGQNISDDIDTIRFVDETTIEDLALDFTSAKDLIIHLRNPVTGDFDRDSQTGLLNGDYIKINGQYDPALASSVEYLVFSNGLYIELQYLHLTFTPGQLWHLSQFHNQYWAYGNGAYASSVIGDGEDGVYGQANDIIDLETRNQLISGEQAFSHTFIYAGVGDDHITGTPENSHYFYALGDGNDTIIDRGGDDSLFFGRDISRDNLEFLISGTDLTVLIRYADDPNKDGSIFLKDGAASAATGSGDAAFERLVFTDGSTVSLAEMVGLALASNGDDTISWDNTALSIDGGDGNDTIISGARDDYLFGGNGVDTLSSGGGDDLLNPGKSDGFTPQILKGGDGDDVYVVDRNAGEVHIAPDAELIDGGFDVLYLPDLLFADITVSVVADSSISWLVLSWDGDPNGSVRVAQDGTRIERYVFADGTTIDGFDFDASGLAVPRLNINQYPEEFSQDGWLRSNVPGGYRLTDQSDQTIFVDFAQLQPSDPANLEIDGTGYQGIEGDDRANSLSAVEATESSILIGGLGADTLTGGIADDTLYGDEGADTLHGRRGDDILLGGDGADKLFGDGEEYISTRTFNQSIASAWWTSREKLIGDVDGDGRDDLIAFTEVDDENENGQIHVWLGQGNGDAAPGTLDFDAAAQTTTHGLAGSWWAEREKLVGDVNGDGRVDIIAFVGGDATDTEKVIVLFGQSSGSFAGVAHTFDGIGGSWWADREKFIGDVNGDGFDDIIALTGGNIDNGQSINHVNVWFGSQQGTFTLGQQTMDGPNGSANSAIANIWWVTREKFVGDFNGDGHTDILGLIGDSTNNAYVWFGQSDGSFVAGPSTQTELAGVDWVGRQKFTADINGDGRTDIVALYGDGSGKVYSWLSTSNGQLVRGDVVADDLASAWWESRQHHIGDVNGDGLDEVIALAGDGSEEVLIRTIETGHDRLVGGAGDDELYGGSGNDILAGGPGDDRLFGDDGIDHLLGGDGSDDLYGGDGGDTLDGGAGKDRANYTNARSGVTASLADRSLNQGAALGDVYYRLEDLMGSSFDDVLIGNSQSNSLWGGEGQDELLGGDGDDQLIGGLGPDILSGGAGVDLAGYLGASAWVIANLSNPSQNTGEAAGDTFNSIEGLQGSAYDDTLIGDSGNNRLFGENGSDTIYGGAGSDELDGGDGNDNLSGGSGYDTLWGGGGNDTLAGGENFDILYGHTGNDILDGGGDDDILSGGGGNDTLIGDEGNDTLNGDGGNDLLSGNQGDDVLVGGADNDVLNGGDGNDQLFAGSGDDVSRGQAGDDFISSGAGDDTLEGGSENDSLFGGFGVDTLLGDAGDDYLHAGASNDFLFGGSGNDILEGREDDDVLNGGAGTDTLTGGTGADTFVFGVAFGHDTVKDFQNNIDQLDLTAFNFAAVNGALSFMTEVAGDVIFASGPNTFTIENITKSQLTDDILI
ncbi:MAG: FG-GAP-like repeat-containing protein [Pseudomonadota bacterium]